jgi:hypothetical protein
MTDVEVDAYEDGRTTDVEVAWVDAYEVERMTDVDAKVEMDATRADVILWGSDNGTSFLFTSIACISHESFVFDVRH